MKKLIFILSALSLFILPSYSYPSGLGSLHMSLIEGDVQINAEDTEGWVPATINMPVREGDRLTVSYGGRVELLFRNGTYLRLDENSSVEVLAAEANSFRFYLESGHAYVNFNRTGRSSIELSTPLTSIKSYNKSIFRVDVSGPWDTQVSVFKGSVSAEDSRGKTKVVAGETLHSRDRGYSDIYALGPSDEWEGWNRDRDSRLAEYRSSYQYLPEELRVYSYDFDNYGKWVYVREYGYVWTPTVVVSAGWSPYRAGRWAWRGGDYVWLSHEPWGWAPYHYGRWSFVVSIGWCWVPPARGHVYWGPGFVGWVSTPSYVAWVPLAPGEIYYGYGYYGPHSVNILNININKTQIKKVYRNAHVTNAATVISRESFASSKPVEIRPKANPFLSERINIGRPSVSSDAARSISVPREAPQQKQRSTPVVKEPYRSTQKPPEGTSQQKTYRGTTDAGKAMAPSQKQDKTPTYTTPQRSAPSTQGAPSYSVPQSTAPSTKKQSIDRPAGDYQKTPTGRPSEGTSQQKTYKGATDATDAGKAMAPSQKQGTTSSTKDQSIGKSSGEYQKAPSDKPVEEKPATIYR